MKIKTYLFAALTIMLFSMISLSAVQASPATTVAVVCHQGDAGYNPSADLTGTIKFLNGKVSGIVVNTSSVCAYEVGTAVYRRFDNIVDHQELFSSVTGIVLPGQTLTLGPISKPTCASQIDVFYGQLLNSLYHQRYGKRILRAVYSGTQYCSGNQGCTPGYWKNHQTSWTPSGLTPAQTTGSVFANASVFPVLSAKPLIDALQGGGGSSLQAKAQILLRAAVAAELNALHPGVSYPRSAGQILDDVNAALQSGNATVIISLATALDNDNNRGCPLN